LGGGRARRDLAGLDAPHEVVEHLGGERTSAHLDQAFDREAADRAQHAGVLARFGQHVADDRAAHRVLEAVADRRISAE
jgi:hypothetical protein